MPSHVFVDAAACLARFSFTEVRPPIGLIAVPYAIGDERDPASRGPGLLLDGGLLARLEAHGVAHSTHRLRSGIPFTDSLSASAAVSGALTESVREVLAHGEVPLVLAGSCDGVMGLVAALGGRERGAIWIDAHPDFHTPNTTRSGYLPGMALAILAGHAYPQLHHGIAADAAFDCRDLLLVGVRDCDPAERDRIERFAIQVVPWHGSEPGVSLDKMLERLARRRTEVYVHVDLDALDPVEAPGIVSAPVAGGPTLAALTEVIAMIGTYLRISAASVATYDLMRDTGGRAIASGVVVVESLALAVR